MSLSDLFIVQTTVITYIICATSVCKALNSKTQAHNTTWCQKWDTLSTSDAIPESTPTVRPQEPADEPASDSQSSQESSSYEPISRSPDKDPDRTRYGRVVKPPNRYVA
ncbi:hypothetical protein AVEN_135617-1 [Araneus ventricosus]|uniref:Uncharacterized protein n=1 Tax=Araneus ventricosus TaxID=182803 RepID=A0A4Y2DSW6_ARAVE|nr:hypothetical protein AVEN_135617-1 [Araneus ventricosus]